MMTFRAPPLRWAAAATLSVKWPVDSMTMSAPTSPHAMPAGSWCAKTVMRLPWIVIASPSKATPSRWPETESHSSSVASVRASVRSLTATTSTSASFARAARR